MASPLVIDGSHGEGGGQVLRTSLTLAVLTGRAVKLTNIRAGRKKPGLAPQHLTNVVALAEICGARLDGAHLGSTEIVFEPKSRLVAGRYIFDVSEVAGRGSAGSVILILQTLLLPLVFASANSRVILRGGTHVPWSPSFDDLTKVYLPVLQQMGLTVDCMLERFGFYPAGGGQIEATIYGGAKTLTPLTLTERGHLQRIHGRAVTSNLPSHIARRMQERAKSNLEPLGTEVDIVPQTVKGKGPGAGIFLCANYEHTTAGFAALGKRGKPAEQVAEEACQALLAHHETGAATDRHLADQLLLPMALAEGRSSFTTSCVTGHLLTNAHIIQRFIAAEIEIEGREGKPGTVAVNGVGLRKE